MVLSTVASKSLQTLVDVLPIIERRSHCRRNQVAAILTNKECDCIISFGYNGNVKGGPNACDTGEVGNCGCLHAEINALIKPRSTNPHLIICSVSPCLMCAKAIINAGIKVVVFSRYYRTTESLLMFDRHEIQYLHLPIGEFSNDSCAANC